MADQKLSVLIDQDIIAELLLRGGSQLDVGNIIKNVLDDFLERTSGDPMWTNPAYLREQGFEDEADFVDEFGPPNEGYRWERVFLPNGTRIKMTYRREDHFARVDDSKIRLENYDLLDIPDNINISFTPSELARKFANNTNRNAWRDLWVKRPGDTEWIPVEDLRRAARV